jgi:quercetin dioxygenase-like cupin family protein
MTVRKLTVTPLAVTLATLVAMAGIGAALRAQQPASAPAFKRTVLQQADISVPGREAVTALAEIPPGVAAGRHSHPGEEVGYILEGTVLVEQDGKPPATLEAGKTFLIPAGTIHNATNKGSGTAKVVATYIVEKGKPLATPAPAK